MTFQEFSVMRKGELYQFFRDRFGPRWRQVATHQLGIHPRTFERWKRGSAVPRRLGLVEAWARSIGFTSPADKQIRRAIREYRRFHQLTRRQITRKKTASERISPEPTPRELQQSAIHAAVLAALNGAGSNSDGAL